MVSGEGWVPEIGGDRRGGGLRNGLIRLKMLYRNRHYVHTYLPVVRRQLMPIFTVTHRVPDSAARMVFVLGLLEHGSGITF